MIDSVQVVNNEIFINSIKEVTTNEEIALICKRVGQWKERANAKIPYFKDDFKRAQIAKDVTFVADDIQLCFRTDTTYEPRYSVKTIEKGENAVFAAYDNRGKLQGIALVDLLGYIGYDNTLDSILVNPERMLSIGNKEAIKKTGTKLVQAVAKKVLMKKREQNLGTLSLLSAVPFYLKLGFVSRHPGSTVNTQEMCLNHKQIEQLCQS